MFGIDLGSSYIRMAYLKNKQAEIVHVSFNPPIGSGLVYFSGTSIHIGDDITADIFNRKNHETFGVMRLIGRHYDTSVQRFSAYLPYTVLNVDGLPMIGCTHQGIKKMISPEHVLCYILKVLNLKALTLVGPTESPTFVVSVPGSCSYAHRRAVITAATRVRMRLNTIVNDTTATAIYKMDAESWPRNVQKSCAIINLGGNSVTVTVASLSKCIITVLATTGASYVGGHDYEVILIEHLKGKFEEQNNRPMTEHEERQLIEECSRRPVLELLDTTYTDSLPTSSTDAAESFIFIQSEDSFKWMTSVDDLIKQCMAESRFRPRGSGTNIIDKIVLTGSWGLWKKLMYHISEYFGCKGTNARFASKSHDRTMVARGAALLVMYQECKVDFKLIELTSKLTVKNPKDIETVVIAAQTPIPIERTVYFVVGARCIENYVLFRVFEHPRNKSERSICLGGVSLIHPCSKLTICHVKVTFNIREDYRFIVTVTDEIHNLQREVVISEDTGDDITINHDNMSNINEISEEMYRKNLQLQNRFKTPAIPPTLPKSQSPTKKAEDKSKLPDPVRAIPLHHYEEGIFLKRTKCKTECKCERCATPETSTTTSQPPAEAQHSEKPVSMVNLTTHPSEQYVATTLQLSPLTSEYSAPTKHPKSPVRMIDLTSPPRQQNFPRTIADLLKNLQRSPTAKSTARSQLPEQPVRTIDLTSPPPQQNVPANPALYTGQGPSTSSQPNPPDVLGHWAGVRVLEKPKRNQGPKGKSGQSQRNVVRIIVPSTLPKEHVDEDDRPPLSYEPAVIEISKSTPRKKPNIPPTSRQPNVTFVLRTESGPKLGPGSHTAPPSTTNQEITLPIANPDNEFPSLTQMLEDYAVEDILPTNPEHPTTTPAASEYNVEDNEWTELEPTFTSEVSQVTGVGAAVAGLSTLSTGIYSQPVQLSAGKTWPPEQEAVGSLPSYTFTAASEHNVEDNDWMELEPTFTSEGNQATAAATGFSTPSTDIYSQPVQVSAASEYNVEDNEWTELEPTFTSEVSQVTGVGAAAAGLSTPSTHIYSQPVQVSAGKTWPPEQEAIGSLLSYTSTAVSQCNVEDRQWRGEEARFISQGVQVTGIEAAASGYPSSSMHIYSQPVQVSAGNTWPQEQEAVGSLSSSMYNAVYPLLVSQYNVEDNQWREEEPRYISEGSQVTGSGAVSGELSTPSTYIQSRLGQVSTGRTWQLEQEAIGSFSSYTSTAVSECSTEDPIWSTYGPGFMTEVTQSAGQEAVAGGSSTSSTFVHSDPCQLSVGKMCPSRQEAIGLLSLNLPTAGIQYSGPGSGRSSTYVPSHSGSVGKTLSPLEEEIGSLSPYLSTAESQYDSEDLLLRPDELRSMSEGIQITGMEAMAGGSSASSTFAYSYPSQVSGGKTCIPPEATGLHSSSLSDDYYPPLVSHEDTRWMADEAGVMAQGSQITEQGAVSVGSSTSSTFVHSHSGVDTFDEIALLGQEIGSLTPFLSNTGDQDIEQEAEPNIPGAHVYVPGGKYKSFPKRTCNSSSRSSLDSLDDVGPYHPLPHKIERAQKPTLRRSRPPKKLKTSGKEMEGKPFISPYFHRPGQKPTDKQGVDSSPESD
ncbi:uncharacterized protein LOC124354346 isoform X3 [Homalodisca vitripennis]|uniref:uncharacterized protein LOC124354346 isoform X3 n=1 Tax=Homalodisca vitripennis TaxID=197043 RepID=UPI001EECD7EC|nr:uncharacterized protein LOC124354346 isoform X3 [Homalodisca vitripennis]